MWSPDWSFGLSVFFKGAWLADDYLAWHWPSSRLGISRAVVGAGESDIGGLRYYRGRTGSSREWKCRESRTTTYPSGAIVGSFCDFEGETLLLHHVMWCKLVMSKLSNLVGIIMKAVFFTGKNCIICPRWLQASMAPITRGPILACRKLAVDVLVKTTPGCF